MKTDMYDPTTAEIEAQIAERDRLRAEVARLSAIAEAAFEKGYDQATREIRDHFVKAGQSEVVAEIGKIWKIGFAARRTP